MHINVFNFQFLFSLWISIQETDTGIHVCRLQQFSKHCKCSIKQPHTKESIIAIKMIWFDHSLLSSIKVHMKNLSADHIESEVAPHLVGIHLQLADQKRVLSTANQAAASRRLHPYQSQHSQEVHGYDHRIEPPHEQNQRAQWPRMEDLQISQPTRNSEYPSQNHINIPAHDYVKL